MADGLVNSPDSLGANFDIDQKDAFLVDLDGFEGPLHLLLALARRQKVDLRRWLRRLLRQLHIDPEPWFPSGH